MKYWVSRILLFSAICGLGVTVAIGSRATTSPRSDTANAIEIVEGTYKFSLFALRGARTLEDGSDANRAEIRLTAKGKVDVTKSWKDGRLIVTLKGREIVLWKNPAGAVLSRSLEETLGKLELSAMGDDRGGLVVIGTGTQKEVAGLLLPGVVCLAPSEAVVDGQTWRRTPREGSDETDVVSDSWNCAYGRCISRVSLPGELNHLYDGKVSKVEYSHANAREAVNVINYLVPDTRKLVAARVYKVVYALDSKQEVSVTMVCSVWREPVK